MMYFLTSANKHDKTKFGTKTGLKKHFNDEQQNKISIFLFFILKL